MKIMVVNNNVMFENPKGLFIYKETGKFFVDLKNIGNEIFVFQYKMPFGDNDFLADYNLLNSGLNIHPVKRGSNNYLAYLKAFFKAIPIVRKVDFVYLFYPGHICSYLAILAILFRKNFGFYVRGQNNIMSTLSKFLYRKAKLVFTISPEFTEIVNKLGANGYTIRPMMNYGEYDIIYNRQYKNKTEFNFLFVGRIEKDKGVYEIFEAVRELNNLRINNFTMHMVGDGVDAIKLKNLVKQNGLEHLFKFHGTITGKEELSKFYKENDLFVFPSHHEGFPRVLYESLIHGIPILTTFVGTIPYLMKNNDNCYEIEVKNYKSIVDKIKNAISSYTDFCKVATNGTETILLYLSDKKDNHANQLLKVINSD